MSPAESQSAAAVLMVRPLRFGSNPQTRASNAFQRDVLIEDPQSAALREFDALVDELRRTGVRVVAVDDTPEPHTPDALFPNNWFTTHADGTVVLYPMCAPNRRAERRADLLELLDDRGFACNRLVDLTAHETGGRYLEGTGSLVLDRVARIAFACLSPRTDLMVLDEWGKELGYRTFPFDAHDASGHPIYHTNVLLAVGSTWAVVCADAITDPRQRSKLIGAIASGDREVIEIDIGQMAGFAGNLLELRDAAGAAVIVMSSQARTVLAAAQLEALGRHGRIVSSPVPTIETAGGGSVRCMLAELFLPERSAQVDEDRR